MPATEPRLPRDNVFTARIRRFSDLVDEVGQLSSHRNPGLYLFRGQTQIHFAPRSDLESILPKFYRKPRRSLRNLLDKLDLVRDRVGLADRYVGSRTAAEAVLQHYEIAGTRMLDVTQVLHVAASFAMHKNWVSEPGPAVVHVFGPIDPIATKNPEGFGAFLVPAVLNRACLRPQRQAAWVLYDPERKAGVVDYARHLVARYWIAAEDAAGFWEGFAPYGYRWLMEDDYQAAALRELGAEIVGV